MAAKATNTEGGKSENGNSGSSQKSLRSVICTVLGHVDHGKSSILDRIRGTSIVKSEPGQITQAIGASIVPVSVIKKLCGPLLQQLKLTLTIPGLLLIDTPGHAAFVSLRKRGGVLADIAILVIDLNAGFMPQTLEALDILKNYKTPFIVAANKLDLVPGWRTDLNVGNNDTFAPVSAPGSSVAIDEELLLAKISKQQQPVQEEIDKRLYNLVAKFAELGFDSDRFDRVSDYSKQLAIIPCSAKTGVGVPELLVVVSGLAQRFLESELSFNPDSAARGTVLEVKQEKGLGATVDVIIYDGSIKKNDEVVIGGLEGPIVTKVKALLEPSPLSEMRDSKAKFSHVDKVVAATGVKIVGAGVDYAVAGMPVVSTSEILSLEAAKELVQKEISEFSLKVDSSGIVIKADTLGSLEALMKLLHEKGISVKSASIGGISRKDIADAESNLESDPLNSAILGFNVALSKEIEGSVPPSVKVITGNIIYSIEDEFLEWQKGERQRLESKSLEKLTKPCRIQILRGYTFRQSNPAIVGVEVLAGTVAVGTNLMKATAAADEVGKPITSVKEIQLEKENVTTAGKGKQVAVSLEKVIVSRQINEGDILLSFIPEEDFRRLKELKQYLSPDEVDVLREISELMRRENPVWGI
ncbi:translation initiation factor IF-2 [Candidatus Woesearchaeota archaeon]|nr:translation initiation factor IF-2 [Candidatus Woesearchaeota archaeon]